MSMSVHRERTPLRRSDWCGDTPPCLQAQQDQRTARVDLLREWLKTSPGWRTIIEAAKGTGLSKIVVSEITKCNPATFARQCMDPAGHEGHERWLIRRHRHLEAYDAQG